jgi:hypothetical protein
MIQNPLKMDRSKFAEFLKYILRANSANRCVIEIFQTQYSLYNEVKDQLIHLKPETDKYQYSSHLDSLLYDLNKLDYSKDLDYSKVDVWLKKNNTSREEFLQWHTEDPNVSHWHIGDPSRWHTEKTPNNLLFEILKTDLELMAILEYPNQEIYPHLNNYTYSELQLIQYECENIIKNICVNKLIDFIKNQKQLLSVNSKIIRIEKFRWFKVALLFATGEMEKLKVQYNCNASEIARIKFGDDCGKYRPYISQSFGSYKKGNKNIFNDIKKLNTIKKYCDNNNIIIDEGFLDKINLFQPY